MNGSVPGPVKSPLHLAGLLIALAAPLAAAAPLSHAAVPEPRRARIIGYYDAEAQADLPVGSLRNLDLTHVVLTNAISVTSNGTVVYREAGRPSELPARELLRALARLPDVRLIVSLRGHPDDVALDELSEVDGARRRFAAEVAALADGWNASGLELEWHSDDLGGGKAASAPFDEMEQYHLALLCRDLASSLKAAGGGTLSVAVRPGRQEFADANFVRGFVDWLSVQAFSMRSLGDPHHASLKDMETALGEWQAKGVPNPQLVLGTPLFARPGDALHSAGDRNEGLRQPWRDIVEATSWQRQLPAAPLQDRRLLMGGMPLAAVQAHASIGDLLGDRFVDNSTGKIWWASGMNTTRAKMQHVLRHGYGGIALWDLHSDSEDPGTSLVRATREAELDARGIEASVPAAAVSVAAAAALRGTAAAAVSPSASPGRPLPRGSAEAEVRQRRQPSTASQTPVLFQRGMGVSKIAALDAKHDEF